MENYFKNCVYFQTKHLDSILNRYAIEEFEMTGFAPSYGFLLLALKKSENKSPSYLAKILNLSPSTITRFIDKLEKDGYVVRDGKVRNKQINLTELGDAKIPVIIQAWKNLHERYMTYLTKEQEQMIQASLALGIEALEKDQN